MSTPVSAPNTTDPGDEVIRKFRYQFGYGAILAIRMLAGDEQMVAIWCEQHEDILVELKNGHFAAYQIKTKRTENGAWRTTEASFEKSIRRFIQLDKDFPSLIDSFHFVSNTECFDTDGDTEKAKSPVKLLQAVRAATQWTDLAGEERKCFDTLRTKLGADPVALFQVLQRLALIKGPTEDAFEDEICQTHLPTLDQCTQMNPATLSRVCNALIARVFEASSLQAQDPSRNWADVVKGTDTDPYLRAKKLVSDHFMTVVQVAGDPAFKYLHEFATLNLGTAGANMSKLEKKFRRGGLGQLQSEAMRRRALSAEQVMLEFASRPDGGKQRIADLESVVLGECADAELQAKSSTATWGPTMYLDLQERLRKKAQENPSSVYRQDGDMLIGVAGLLTTSCQVWWSDHFNLDEA